MLFICLSAGCGLMGEIYQDESLCSPSGTPSPSPWDNADDWDYGEEEEEEENEEDEVEELISTSNDDFMDESVPMEFLERYNFPIDTFKGLYISNPIEYDEEETGKMASLKIKGTKEELRQCFINFLVEGELMDFYGGDIVEDTKIKYLELFDTGADIPTIFYAKYNDGEKDVFFATRPILKTFDDDTCMFVFLIAPLENVHDNSLESVFVDENFNIITIEDFDKINYEDVALFGIDVDALKNNENLKKMKMIKMSSITDGNLCFSFMSKNKDDVIDATNAFFDMFVFQSTFGDEDIKEVFNDSCIRFENGNYDVETETWVGCDLILESSKNNPEYTGNIPFAIRVDNGKAYGFQVTFAFVKSSNAYSTIIAIIPVE